MELWLVQKMGFGFRIKNIKDGDVPIFFDFRMRNIENN